MLLNSQPEYLEMLRGYMADLRREGGGPPLSVRLSSKSPQFNTLLLEYVRQMTLRK